MDRFTLLLLEPGEIYFEDFAVTYHLTPNSKSSGSNDEIRGRLKICSKSFVFAPQDNLRPLIKFPLADCQSVEEWFPKSFQSKLAKERNILSITCRSCVEMLERNVTAPFTFRRDPGSYIFSLQYGKADDYVSQMCQLQRAATLPPVEQNGMIAAIVYSRQNRLPFDMCSLESVQETILMKTIGNKIQPLVINPGRVVLTDEMLYFQPYNNLESTPVIKVRLSSIKRIFQRRYLLRPLGLEIYYVNHKQKPDHIYLTFSKPEERRKLYHKMIAQENLSLEDIREENMTLQWQNGLISNFEYLLYLNSAADRSFNDLTQYPVMPWVVSDYTSSTLDLANPSTFRDLSKPMGALNAERLANLKDRAQDMPEPRFLYGSHYSTPGFVLYYLVRKIPECMLCLQNGKFDHPDRMFNSVPQTWINVTTHNSDFKELLPEFYMPENKGDFLKNSRHIDFGVRHDGKTVGDVELPPWAEGSPEVFVQKLREALESDYVSRHLHKWIDLVFGYKQRGREAELSDNLFYHLCYEGSVDMDSITNLDERYALEIQIGEFGQVPRQLFTAPHPQRSVEDVGDLPDNEPKTNIIANGFNGTAAESRKEWKMEMKNFRRICDYQVHKEPLSAVALSVDKLWVFSCSHDSTLRMYSLAEMHILRNVTVSNMKLSCCIPLPNNKTVLLASWDNTLCSYSIEFGKTSDFLSVHDDAISCMDWSSGVLATGSWDCTAKVWHCNEANGYRVRLDNDLIAVLDHNSHVTCVNICTQTKQLVTGTRDGSVVLWCTDTFSMIQELQTHSRQVNGVRFSPEGRRVISCGSDFKMKVIDLKTGSIPFSKDLGEELTCLDWDGRFVLVGGSSGHLSLWDLQSVRPLGKVIAQSGSVTSLHVSRDGEVVVTGGEDRKVVVWKTKPPKTCLCEDCD